MIDTHVDQQVFMQLISQKLGKIHAVITRSQVLRGLLLSFFAC